MSCKPDAAHYAWKPKLYLIVLLDTLPLVPFFAGLLKFCIESTLAVSSIALQAGKLQGLLLQVTVHIILVPPQLSYACVAGMYLIP